MRLLMPFQEFMNKLYLARVHGIALIICVGMSMPCLSLTKHKLLIM
jgi:hypothetical protein